MRNVKQYNGSVLYIGQFVLSASYNSYLLSFLYNERLVLCELDAPIPRALSVLRTSCIFFSFIYFIMSYYV